MILTPALRIPVIGRNGCVDGACFPVTAGESG